jgi:hypothetical protein
MVTLVVLAAVLPLGAPVLAQEIPPIPDPVAISVDRDTTALLLLDFSPTNCPTRPTCVESLPAVAGLLDWARSEGLFVVHSGAAQLPEVAPLPDEPVMLGGGPDKFLNNNLDDILRERGIQTLIITGTASNGAVLYTSFEAAARGYTVAVVEDCISGTRPFDTILTRYQLLNGPGTANPTNEPLRERAVTLTRSDLISLR